MTSFRPRKPSSLYRAIFPRVYVSRKFQLGCEKTYRHTFPADTDHEASFLVESATQTECLSQVEKIRGKQKRKYFIDQATCSKSCCRHTGVARCKLDLVFEFLEPKATEIRLWRGK